MKMDRDSRLIVCLLIGTGLVTSYLSAAEAIIGREHTFTSSTESQGESISAGAKTTDFAVKPLSIVAFSLSITVTMVCMYILLSNMVRWKA